MEDTLRVSGAQLDILQEDVGLNPCFNGRYSQSTAVAAIDYHFLGLNPCFHGRYSQRFLHFV